MSELNRKDIVGARLTEIGHSAYSQPEFVIEGIGPAEFRTHYLRLESGIVLDIFTAEILTANIDVFEMPAETDGIPPDQLIGRRVTGFQRDDCHSSLVILDGLIYLRDANDGCYGNPLRAGFIEEDYTPEERGQFADYWEVA